MASFQDVKPEKVRMRVVPVPGGSPSPLPPSPFQGRTAQAHAQASAVPGSADAVDLSPLPRPAQLLSRLALRPAPGRGLRDPVLPCPRRSITRPRAGERPGPWGPMSLVQAVREAAAPRVRRCHLRPWPPARFGWGGGRPLI
ncbi:hypothetical protein HispidOSU_016521 [Sigmodon hispidus]